MAELDDIALLREYAERGSEAAFATLVARHVDKVYSVALRHTGNPHQAEEITQVVFVILAKKGRRLGRGVILSGWLYQAARFTAVTFLRGEIRRTRREQEARMPATSNDTEPDIWPQMAPLLDAAMAGLNEKERTAIVLRFFDGCSLREIGAALGGSESSAKMRVSRAVHKLQKFFARHGVTSTAEALAGAIAAHAVQASPVPLAPAIAATALAKGVTASASNLALLKGALKFMAWTKIKTALVVSVAVVAVAGGSAVALRELNQKAVRRNESPVLQFTRTPRGAVAMEAVRFMFSLKKQGQMPGLAIKAPIAVEIPWYTRRTNEAASWFPDTNAVTYPLQLTLRVHADDTNSVYRYTLDKASETDRWHLQKSWREDLNGKVLEEFSIVSSP